MDSFDRRAFKYYMKYKYPIIESRVKKVANTIMNESGKKETIIDNSNRILGLAGSTHVDYSQYKNIDIQEKRKVFCLWLKKDGFHEKVIEEIDTIICQRIISDALFNNTNFL